MPWISPLRPGGGDTPASLRIIGFSGNTRRPSRSRLLVEAVASELELLRPISPAFHDLAEVGPELGATSLQGLPRAARAIIDALEQADALIIGTPVYKGSYAGLFKHLVDFIDPTALVNKPVVLTATGGGYRHALMVDHQLRPLFAFFSALTMPTAVYAAEQDFRDGAIADAGLAARIAQAAAELDRSLRPIGQSALHPSVTP